MDSKAGEVYWIKGALKMSRYSLFVTPGRRSSSDFTPGGRGSPRTSAVAAVAVACEAEAAKPDCN